MQVYVIVILMLYGSNYKITSPQHLFNDLAQCEQARKAVVEQLLATKPTDQKSDVASRCVRLETSQAT